MGSKPNQNVQELLVKLGPYSQALVKRRGSISFRERITYNPQLGRTIVSADKCVVGKVMNLDSSFNILWSVFYNPCLDLLMNSVVILLQHIRCLPQAF